MTFVYRIGVGGYQLLIRLAALLGKEQAKKWVAGRQQAPPLPEVLHTPLPGHSGQPPLLWMHCASLGEWEQGRPVLLAFREENPAYRAILTFFSPSGYERCRNETAVDHVAYLPPDSPGGAARWLKDLRPDLAIFVKYEFWYFHLRELHRSGVPTFLVAANFREDQHFFRWYGSWGRKMLRFFSGIVTQQRAAAELLVNEGNYPENRLTVAGDPRMDRTLEVATTPFSDDIIAAFTQAGTTIIAGSVWPEDLKVLAEAWPGLPPDTRLLLAPHQLHAEELARTQVQWNAERYTQADPTTVADSRVLILDTIGMLSRVYRYGEIAYVGGAFRTGLHNTLEPLAYGLPVVFGPGHEKFPEAAAAIAAGGAWSISSGTELRDRLQQLLRDEVRQRASNAQRALGARSAGAATRTVSFITENLPSPSES